MDGRRIQPEYTMQETNRQQGTLGPIYWRILYPDSGSEKLVLVLLLIFM